MAERMAYHRARIVTFDAEITSLKQQLGHAKRRITPALNERFGVELSKRLREVSPDFRRGYVALLVDRVSVSNEVIQIAGSKRALEHALATNEKGTAAAVPIFDRKWCPEEDSNLHALASAST
jgi:site-specific DNA recombinase